MYQGKPIKSTNSGQYNRVRQLMMKTGVDLNNRPDPYAMIRDDERQKYNKRSNVPYNWINNRLESSNNESSFQDPNASVTISRAQMSRQGFNRQSNQVMNQSINNQSQNRSFNNSSSNFQNNQPKIPGQSTLSTFFRPNNSNNNASSNNNNFYGQNNNTYSGFNSNNSYNSNNNSIFSTNHNNQNQSQNFRNLQFIEELLDDDSIKNYSNNYQQIDFDFPYEQNPVDRFQQQKPQKIRPRDTFKRQENSPVNQFQQQKNERIRPRDIFKKQDNYKKFQQKEERKSVANQKLCGLNECDPNSKLTTMKILQPMGPLVRNYEIGDIKMWQINNKFSDYTLKDALRNFPHIKDFKNNQKAVIKCALNNNDVFVCIPTGGGKSLIFQIMTFIKKGIYLCILPLISLIYDQQIQAQKFNIEAYSLTGATNGPKIREIYSKIASYTPDKKSLLIFCTPEKISLSQNFMQILTGVYNKGYLQHVIIDEVHCVSTWGRQFRKEYQNLSEVKVFFPKTPILGLTATVTQTVKQEIIKKLKLKNCYFFQSSFNRPNLMYEVRQKSKRSAVDEICSILQSHKNESGIIYCLSKKQCEEMCKNLNGRKYLTAFYHADLHDNDKRQIQQMWMQNKIRIIIATIAFGMGINKPDVRFVIHNSLSKSLENYYQESGRAGRDGNPAKCILFYQRSDRTALQSMILKNQYSSAASKMFSNRQLAQMVKYCQEKYLCRRQFQLNYLGEKDFNPEMCQKTCDNCIKGRKFKHFQCIVHGKEIVKFLEFVSDKKDKITKAQMIGILKNKSNKGKNNSKIISYPYLPKVQDLFKNWTNDQLEEILLQLLSEQVLKQNVVTTHLKKIGNISNVYIECNFSKSHKFLDRVETLPMRRQIRQSAPNNTPSSKQYDEQFFNELFSEDQEEKSAEIKQDFYDFSDNNSYDPYDHINFGDSSSPNNGFAQFEYNENYEERANQIRQENDCKEKQFDNKVQIKNQVKNQDEKRAKIIDYLQDLFNDQDIDI